MFRRFSTALFHTKQLPYSLPPRPIFAAPLTLPKRLFFTSAVKMADTQKSHPFPSLEKASKPELIRALESSLRTSFSSDSVLPTPSPLILVISGPSGVGKDAVIKRLREVRENLHFVVTATSRAMRPGEVDGKDYFFVSKEEFLSMVEKDELLEYALVYGDYKGIPKKQIREFMGKGCDIVLRVDIQGAETLRRILGDSGVFIFLVAESELALVERLIDRKTESKEELLVRVSTAREEAKEAINLSFDVRVKSVDFICFFPYAPLAARFLYLKSELLKFKPTFLGLGYSLEAISRQFLVKGRMAQILAPSTQWQMRVPKSSTFGSPIATKMWSSLLLKQNMHGAAKATGKFRVLALQSDNSTVNRVEQLLNMDVTPYTDKIIAEYIWIGGSGLDTRSKSRTIAKPVQHPSELPKWNYDGSSTGQAPGEDSEVILYPQAIFKDPFRGGNNILVICDTYTPAGEPIPTNKRHKAAEIFSNKKVVDEVPWFGIEQEYTLLQQNVKWPLGWPVGGYPGPQGPYYCGAGADKSFGRDISDAHYKACLYAGINISGTNGEVMPGQWEYQVGPSVGIEAGDHIWCSRYILERITEQAGVVLSLDPKPIEGDWNGAGCHTNYSTKSMREEGGFEVIKKAILNLSLRHKEHISAYGEGNERRLTGKHETASINTFSWGVANRGCSIRVGRDTEKNGKGYLEDRRPASNMDPYVVTGLLAETTILYEPTLEAEALAAQKIALKV
ncbi:hypothetical protein V6N12_017659 [Hibiscus sabdariffa]|uniref:Glutamine synthetase n=1 Tax=Hibiscus sabdariffa TaxID=183260 RepID=A0ABR2CG62_9ROSI